MKQAIERWAPVRGFDGRYEISDRGNLRSVSREFIRSDGRTVRVIGKKLKIPLDRKGYSRLAIPSLPRGGKAHSLAIHRAVLMAFAYIDGCHELHVNHKDGVKTNNQLVNLEWCTNSENRLHSYRVLGVKNPQSGKTGAMHQNSKPVVGQCITTGEKRSYPSASSVVQDGFSPGGVRACVAGSQHSHRDWTWQHAEDANHGSTGGKLYAKGGAA